VAGARFRTCLACWKWIGGEEVGAEEFEEVLAALVAGGGEAGEDFPGSLAAAGLVSAGELSGDDGGTQSAFGPMVGRFDAGMIEEGEQPLPPFAQEVDHPLLVGIGSRRQDQSVGLPLLYSPEEGLDAAWIPARLYHVALSDGIVFRR
jgi:hypothetical protein